ncbi:hypothetical protein BO70DRAFT_359599 [Aspergillus heteromorphus CBS 117.55]|uniref:Uncharacterized protein n=1 Tax=Aspergillus heteromorphus CBS 117.55 TaxID=1448321 RepID=A0A317WWZ0_9EURO|nr:uncharacterized protein BO70DRAFT_359599 [Aspergillus heteromorphus CBS 117.55]PWY89318.1 hypothetical protein BO70DRAFT_359599 [Aspergillus heteromorphus CBS 117.55]
MFGRGYATLEGGSRVTMNENGITVEIRGAGRGRNPPRRNANWRRNHRWGRAVRFDNRAGRRLSPARPPVSSTQATSSAATNAQYRSDEPRRSSATNAQHDAAVEPFPPVHHPQRPSNHNHVSGSAPYVPDETGDPDVGMTVEDSSNTEDWDTQLESSGLDKAAADLQAIKLDPLDTAEDEAMANAGRSEDVAEKYCGEIFTQI